MKRDTTTRTGPGPDYEPTGAALAGVSALRSAVPEAFRVLAGDRVVVEAGPLRMGDMDWFLVTPTEDRGEISVPAAIVPTSAAWVPARDGEATLFEPIDGSTANCVFVAAAGPGRSALTVPPDGCSSGGLCRAGALTWVAAAPLGESCRLLVTDSDSQEVMIEADVMEWSSGAVWSHTGETRLIVDTDCTWSLRTTET